MMYNITRLNCEPMLEIVKDTWKYNDSIITCDNTGSYKVHIDALI